MSFQPLKHLRDSISDVRNQPREIKISLLFLSLTYFFILLSYPLLRSTTTAIFLNAFGAKSSPMVWLLSIVVLSITAAVSNQLQKKYSMRKLFLATSLFSFIFFIGGEYFLSRGYSIFAYLLFIWKESYIIILIHMCLGLFNASSNSNFAKSFYGIIGVFGSLGGIAGGLLTSRLTYLFENDSDEIKVIIYIGATIILFSAITFIFTNKLKGDLSHNDSDKQTSPIASISEVKKYVFYTVLLIILTQFVINLGNFKFNIIFSELVQTKILKTRYLGYIYTAVNSLSLIIQLAFMPILLKGFKLRSVHMGIPIIYAIISFLGFGLGAAMLLPVALTFITFKGIDYSLFNAAKELLYFPLTPKQRYGAKYLADMISYRLGKGLISLILLFYQSVIFVNSALIISLILWPITIIILFKNVPTKEIS